MWQSIFESRPTLLDLKPRAAPASARHIPSPKTPPCAPADRRGSNRGKSGSARSGYALRGLWDASDSTAVSAREESEPILGAVLQLQFDQFARGDAIAPAIIGKRLMQLQPGMCHCRTKGMSAPGSGRCGSSLRGSLRPGHVIGRCETRHPPSARAGCHRRHRLPEWRWSRAARMRRY